MRKMYLLIAVFFAVCASTLNVQAQTDVTATYLTNAGFETSPTGVAVDNTIYDVAGWTEFPVAGVLTYYKLATIAYGSVTTPLGTVPANGSSVLTENTTLLGLKMHWGPSESYVQQIVNLPIGKYTITWDSYLAQVATSQASRCGVVIDGVATYDNLPTAINTWKNHSITFTIASAKDVTIRMGYNKTVSVGGAASPILFVDNIKLAILPVDKIELQNQLGIATTMYGSQQPVGASTVYADLNTAIAAAQSVYDNASATVEQVLVQEVAIKAAIAKVNSAILLESRATTWTTFPYNATSAIVNPSFELNTAAGWENPNGLAINNSTAMGAYKVGTYFAEKWVGSPGTQVNLNISQVIDNVPNGIYRITAGAQAIQQTATPSYPGKAYIFANGDSTEVFIVNNYTVQTNVTNNTLKIGFATKTTGNWVALDNFQLSYLGNPKSVLNSLLVTANGMIASPENVGPSTVYTDLGTAVSAAQTVYNNASATLPEIAAQETAMNTAISNVQGAILLQTRISTWTTLPLDVTSTISNPSFENSATAGWTNVGGFVSQNNTTFSFKAGTYYVEKWQATGNWTGLKLSQKIINLPNGVYNLTAAALNEPTTTGGAFIFANAVKAEVFSTNDYSLTVTVTNNELEVGYEVVNGGNYVGVDNFRLTYVSDGSPYMLINPTALSFTPGTNQKTVNIAGGNLTSDIVLAPTSSFSLSKTTITAAEAMATGGVDVVVTCNGTSALTNDSLIFTCGALRNKVVLTLAESAVTTSTAGLFFDQSLASAMTFNVSGDLFSTTVLSAPAGITLSETTVTPVDAKAGKAITATWNQLSRIENKYIYLTSGVKKDSVLVFAVIDNAISAWDGDNAEVTPSKMTDFGWSQTLADGVTDGPVVFNEYNVTGGSRYVPAVNAAHTYKGKTWLGHRVAYLRTWGSPATNVFNLSVELIANRTYVFRAVSAWHNNETNPTFTYAVNTAKSNLGTTLGSQSVLCTVKQQGEDYGFEFTPTTTGTHYLTVSSNTVNDVMFGIDYLAIYPKVASATGLVNTDASTTQVYPTVTKGSVNVILGGKSGIIRVYNIAGKLILSKTASSSIETVSLPSAGMYLVEVTSANITKTVKVMKVK